MFDAEPVYSKQQKREWNDTQHGTVFKSASRCGMCGKRLRSKGHTTGFQCKRKGK